MMKKFILLLLVGLVAIITACDVADDLSLPPNPGFTVVTTVYDPTSLVPREEVLPNVTTDGDLKWADDDASGFRDHFNEVSSNSGQIRVNNGRAPGTWLLQQFNGPCFRALPFYYHIRRGEINYLRCNRPGSFSFNFNPIPLNANAAPATFQIYGTEISTTYGMPMIQFRNYTGTLVAKVRASSVGQGRVTGSTTTIKTLPSGSYTAQVWSVMANGSTKLAGTAPMRVYRPQPPPNPCDIQYIQNEEGQEIALAPPTCQ
jgi:hypothetical protein